MDQADENSMITDASGENHELSILPPQTLYSEDSASRGENTGFFKRIWSTYDHTFIGNLCLLYINGGFKVLYTVVFQEMLKTKYKLGPDELQVAHSFNSLPWDFKVFYGIISDTVPVPCFPNASKKGYLIIFSTV